MSIQQRLQARLFELLAATTRKPTEKITTEARLWQDLRVGGDDIVELLESLVDEFDLDLESYRYWENFPTEGELCSPLYLYKSLTKTHREIDDLTVDRLSVLLSDALPKSLRKC